jgi:hypothetical protein
MKKLFMILSVAVIYSCNSHNAKRIEPLPDSNSNPSGTEPIITKKLTPTEFVNKLKEKGYFNYTEKAYETIAIKAILKNYDSLGFMTAFSHKSPYQSYDKRFYDCGDGKELFKEGGVISMIEEMQPFFDKVGFPIRYSKDAYTGSIHTIEVNGRSYVLAQGGPLMWGETIAKYADMINNEFALNNKTERIYLMSSDNEYMVFLTKDQYDLLSVSFPPQKRPQEVKEWTEQALAQLQGAIYR